MPEINFYDLPYRLGVGMMILDSKNRVFVGKRIDTKIDAWQMPQGGINPGETPSKAAIREMCEEIGSDKGDIIAESKQWYSYDLPKSLTPKLWGGSFRGQKQKWFLIRFTGTDNDINVNTEQPEFSSWRWINYKELSHIVIPFKRKLYSSVMEEFLPLIILSSPS